MIFHYRCPRCRKKLQENHWQEHNGVQCNIRHRAATCFDCMMKMNPDGITYDEVVKCQTEPKASGEREPSSSGKTGQ